VKQLLHIFFRKANTLKLTLGRCSNWPSIILAKCSVRNELDLLLFRDGFRLRVMPPLKQTWGEVFEPAIADIYGIANVNPDLIIDVGANIGAFACRAAFLHPGATIHAFEPSPLHANLLRENAKLNNLRNITSHTNAVTKNGRDVIFSRLGMGGSSGLFFHEGGDSASIKSVSLDCVDFSHSRFLFLKLDCEGAEGEIIEWVCANAVNLPPRILIACEYHHWCPIPQQQIFHALMQTGFNAVGKILFDENYIFASR
jgi:FkbM family methyltransferase